MTPEQKPKTAASSAVKKPASTPRERARREQEWSDHAPESQAPECESYRDGGSVNECWNRKNY